MLEPGGPKFRGEASNLKKQDSVEKKKLVSLPREAFPSLHSLSSPRIWFFLGVISIFGSEQMREFVVCLCLSHL